MCLTAHLLHVWVERQVEQQDETPQAELEAPEGEEWQRLLYSASGQNMEQASSWKTIVHEWESFQKLGQANTDPTKW